MSTAFNWACWGFCVGGYAAWFAGDAELGVALFVCGLLLPIIRAAIT